MPRNRKRYTWGVLAGILLIVFFAYSPSLNNQFVNWDDDAHLLSNPFIRSLDARGLRDIFSTTVNKVYIPLTSLSFALEYHFFKTRAFIYHFDNLVLHLAVTAMVLVLALQMGCSRLAAAIAALIFGLHPLHVESVAWVTERKDVLYAFFYMAALLCYGQYLKGIVLLNTPHARCGVTASKGMKPYPDTPMPASGSVEGFISPAASKAHCFFIFVIVLGTLSTLAKPMALSLPFILFLCDWHVRRKFSPRLVLEKIYCLLFFLPIIWATYFLQMRLPDNHFPQSLLIWIWSFVFHLRKFFYPDYFALIYKLPQPVSMANPEYFLSVLGVCTLLVGWLMGRKNRMFLFAFFYYLLSIFFLLRFDAKADLNVVADRFMYLPMVGLCIGLGAGYDRILISLRQKKRFQYGLICLGLALLGVLSYKTFQQCRVWYNGVTLWEHQLKTQEKAATALTYNKLAQAYTQQANLRDDHPAVAKAIRYFDIALQIKPDYANVYFNRGNLHKRLGRLSFAEADLKRAVELDPEHFEAYHQLAEMSSEEGRCEEGLWYLDKAMAVSRDNERMYVEVMRTLEDNIRKGRCLESSRAQINRIKAEYSIHFKDGNF